MMFPASIPLYLLSRESKRAATVMLAGEGADEILAGYGGNIRSYWLSRFRSAVPPAVRRLLGRLPLPARAEAIATRLNLDDTSLITGGFLLGGHETITRACRFQMPTAEADDAALVDEVGLPDRKGSFLDRLLYFQLKTYLVALLMKQDKMSMAASIETRVPYLDHHLVGAAFSLPDHFKIKGRTGKHLLRTVSRQLLPAEVIDRPKQGFPVPIARWFRAAGNPFVDVLLDPESLRDGFLDPTYVRSRVQQFLAGENISVELWAMLNLELWRREFLTGARRLQAAAS
jgi:asparagine synthase (glutamine-hydrolysing)